MWERGWGPQSTKAGEGRGQWLWPLFLSVPGLELVIRTEGGSAGPGTGPGTGAAAGPGFQAWVLGGGRPGVLLTPPGPGSPLLASLPRHGSVWAAVHLCPRVPDQPSCLLGACEAAAQGPASPNCGLLSGPSPSWDPVACTTQELPKAGSPSAEASPPGCPLPEANITDSPDPPPLPHGATACSPPQWRGTRGTVKIDIMPCQGFVLRLFFFFNSYFFDKIFSHGGQHWECPFGGCS